MPNSTTTIPLIPGVIVRALLAGNVDSAYRWARTMGPNSSTFAYGGSKIAVARWVRRHATRHDWAGTGIRLNAIAPGAILTPLLQGQLDDPGQGRAVSGFPLPVGHYGDPGQIGDWVAFMCSDAAEFLCGSIVFVDGGSDAYYRANDWPRAPGLFATPRYFARWRAWRRRNSARG